MASGHVVAREVAEAEFSRFCAAWRIDDDAERMGSDDRQSFLDQAEKLIRAICVGDLTVDEQGMLAYKLAFPSGAVETLEIKRPKALAYLAMDDHKAQAGIKKILAFAAVMTGQPVKFLANLDAVDVKILIAVVTLFLAS